MSHVVAKVFGGQGDWYGARLALFWALLATTPMALLYGLMAGFLGPVAGAGLVGIFWLLSFFIIWIKCQREASGA